jgi:predicted patatin/cPLA2 family phospholipase
MGYDSKAVRVKKGDKVIAALSFNKDRERHYIRETVKCLAKNIKARSAKNRGDKDGE